MTLYKTGEEHHVGKTEFRFSEASEGTSKEEEERGKKTAQA
jgi:hypothetical protein